jgi:regulator of CtrA degradation
MSGGSRVTGSDGVTVSFGERFQASEQFDAVFKEGMGLVERTASYLDGPGRAEAKALKAPTNVLYATESMRLTTRLLEIASWLLVRRALKEGEIDLDEARKKRARIKLQSLGRPSHTKGFADLPEGLRGLIEASFSLNDRIRQLDRAMEFAAPEPQLLQGANPVGEQLSRLAAAFVAPHLRVVK